MKIGRNDPCPCGSGKKYKHGCLEKNLDQKNWFAESRFYVQEMSRGGCSAPPQLQADCSANIAKAHTVPKASLRQIATEGQVLPFLPTPANIAKYGSSLHPQRRGVRQASTFTGFCAKHDDAIFAPLEKVPFAGTREQCFLLAYRALARELYLKKGILRFWDKRSRKLSEELGIPKELVLAPVAEFLKGTVKGKNDMESHKLEYDHALLVQRCDTVKASVVELSKPPPVMCSGGIFPEHTFSGERLQVLGNGTGRPSQICFSSFADTTSGFVVFAWLDDGLDHCDRLVDSLQELPDSDLNDSLLRFFFECCENVHIQPCWWESLPKPAQEMLINHMDVLSDFGPADCARDFFSDDGLDYGTWPIKRRYVVQ